MTTDALAVSLPPRLNDLPDNVFDVLVTGGGVNGCGIARDAAGRGLSVVLAEQDDLAQATSSASTKLFHGGLRYLEYFEFRLVREALKERETLLTAMPHISWPMRFVLPYDADLRVPADGSHLSRLLGLFMPWLKGRRPAWLTRLGLFTYDHLGGRKILPGTKVLNLAEHPTGKALNPKFRKAFEYSDCWVQDARLVALNARDAAERGAKILPRTKVENAERKDGLWHVTLLDRLNGTRKTLRARAFVNAAGPWVNGVITGVTGEASPHKIRLVRGSHIVTRRLFDHDQPYFFQLPDGRIIFAIPYERDFTLIGTTDQDHTDATGAARCSDNERDYLLNAASEYLRKPIGIDDVVWSYSGVRPLFSDEGEDGSAQAATRDYLVDVSDQGGKAPLLSVFGGKITTYRKLSESALAKLAPWFSQMDGPWTAGVALAGGDFAHDGQPALVKDLQSARPGLGDEAALRLVRTWGTEARPMLNGDGSETDFGAGLMASEIRHAVEHEFVLDGDDFLWRRSKCGLFLDQAGRDAVSAYVADLTGVHCPPPEDSVSKV